MQRHFIAVLAALLASMAQAQNAPAAADKGEPAVQRTVTEGELVRIEELKVRGQTTRVVVRSKQLDLKAYEVLTGDASRDPSQLGRAAGQRVWNLFAF